MNATSRTPRALVLSLLAVLAGGLSSCSTVAKIEHASAGPVVDAGTWSSMVGTYSGIVSVPITGITWTGHHKLTLGGTPENPKAKYDFGPTVPAKVVKIKSVAPNIVKIQFAHSEAEYVFHGKSVHIDWDREDGSHGTGKLHRGADY